MMSGLGAGGSCLSQEAEIMRIVVQSKLSTRPYLEKKPSQKRAGGVA
jgi:hypothetical protein